MSKTEYGTKTIQSVAKKAKERMKTGFWNRTDAVDLTEVHTKRIVYGELVLFGFKYLTTEELFANIYRVVTAVNVQNPISLLIDRKYFDTLRHEEQQLYILRLAELYSLVKRAYATAQRITTQHGNR